MNTKIIKDSNYIDFERKGSWKIQTGRIYWKNDLIKDENDLLAYLWENKKTWKVQKFFSMIFWVKTNIIKIWDNNSWNIIFK